MAPDMAAAAQKENVRFPVQIKHPDGSEATIVQGGIASWGVSDEAVKSALLNKFANDPGMLHHLKQIFDDMSNES